MIKTKFPPLTKQCENCKKFFEKKRVTGLPEWGRKKYCSKQCHNESKKGKPWFDSTGIAAWNKGKKDWMSAEGKKRISESMSIRMSNLPKEKMKEMTDKAHKSRLANGNYTGRFGVIGALHEGWKGDKASYNSKHKWIQKHWTKIGICEECGSEPKPYNNRKFGTEWHNKDGEYDREDRTTWMEVCKRCHNKLDKI